jgi:DNA-binding transcriptional LysR family regulator
MVLAPSHPKTHMGCPLEGESLPWIDLALFNGETFILQKSSQASRIYVDQAIKYAQAMPGHIFIISNMEAASQLAAEGLGLAFNVLSYTCSYVYPKPVTYFLVGDPGMRIPYFIIRRKDRYVPSYVDDFIKIMQDLWGHHTTSQGL